MTILIPLGNDTVIVKQASNGAVDALGIPARVTTDVPVGGCSVQPRYTTEKDQTTDVTRSMFNIFMPPTSTVAAIKTEDRLVLPTGEVAQVWGQPLPWRDELGSVDHYRVVARQAKG